MSCSVVMDRQVAYHTTSADRDRRTSLNSRRRGEENTKKLARNINLLVDTPAHIHKHMGTPFAVPTRGFCAMYLVSTNKVQCSVLSTYR